MEHHFKIEDAISFGIPKAVLLYNIRFWLNKNKANGTNIKEKDGISYYWTFNSAKAFADLFPYLEPKSISKWILELEKDGIIISSKFNKKGYDRTKWYSLPEYCISPTEQSTAPMEPPIPDNKQQIINTDKPMVTDVPSDVPIAEEIDPRSRLPDKYGKTTLLRLCRVYSALWNKTYGTPCTSNIGRLGKSLNKLTKDGFTEIQIAVLIYTFFHWHGGGGDDKREHTFLSNSGFPIEMMLKKVDIMIAYLTNNIGIEYTNVESVRKYAVRILKDVI